jgi:hypothetical protein
MSERPPNCPIYIECIVTGALQSFHTFNYFISSLLEGDMCLPRLWPSFDDVIWTFSSRSPSDTDYDAHPRLRPSSDNVI